ncbi:MAG: NADH-quinone oxidoreductase subunit A [Fimbriimonadia bacterium]|nr:NADH-quinone oxidoreductase subunit A [Fimbriimonadia bacterium]
MISSYLPLLMIFAIGAVIAAVMVIGSWLFGPKRPSPAKSAPYECGITPVGSARERFPIHFYLIAMLFIVFDVESIFLYPFFVIFKNSAPEAKLFIFIEVAVFVGLIAIGYLYVLKKGALEWEDPVVNVPAKPAQPQNETRLSA